MLSVRVSDNRVDVKTAFTVNCVADGSSDPVAFSTTAAPFGTLTLELARRVKAKADDVDPSLGIISLGAVFDFEVGKLSGFFYLMCNKSLPAAPPSTLFYKLGGTAKASYLLKNTDLTVNRVKPAARDAKAVMAVTTAE